MVSVIALAAVVFVLFAVDITVGEFRIPLGQVFEVLGGGGNRAQRFVVMDSRLPRAVTAVIAGAALGIAGAITQSVLRNPLAGPDVLGITAGAGFAAVAVLAGIGGAATGFAAMVGVPLAALIGGLATAALIYLLAWGPGAGGMRLVLIGIGVNTVLTAGISWLVGQIGLQDAARAQTWLTGSLSEADWTRAAPAGIGLAVVLAVSIGSARSLAVLRFGPDTAAALGVRPRSGYALLLIAAAAAALATAAVGPLAFVALAAPQIARRLLRSPGEPILGSALTGALMVLAADVIANTVLPVGLPVGLVTAVLGGPMLLFLLVRVNRKATLA
jgi:iron complex transport system permease protein